MSLLLLLKYRDKQLWKSVLQTALPNEKIEVYPEVKDASKVEFIVTMRPTKTQVEAFPNLKVVQSIGAGIDYILKADVIRPNVTLARMVDPNLTHDMYEFVLSVILTEMKRLRAYQKQQPQKLWQKIPYRRIKDTTVTIWGLGNIGGYVAQKLAELGFTVKGWSNSPKSIKGVQSYIGKDGLIQSLASADFLVNILPLTPSTVQILNYSNLIHLPKGAFVLNVGRGGHNHEEDLTTLLDEEQLSGLFLDVFQTEPLPPEHIFWTHPKVAVTPHIASVTDPNSVAQVIAENYRRFKSGRPLKNIVNLQKGY